MLPHGAERSAAGDVRQRIDKAILPVPPPLPPWLQQYPEGEPWAKFPGRDPRDLREGCEI